MNNQIMITFQQILDKEPCVEGWAKLLLAKGVIDEEIHDSWVDYDQYDMDGISLPDEPFPLSDILETNDLDDTIWALCCVDDQNLVRKFAIWCAYQVDHLMDDQLSKDALRVAWAYLEGGATKEELTIARHAAGAVDDTYAEATRVAWYAVALVSNYASTVDVGSAVLSVVPDDEWFMVQAAQKIKLKEILDTGECPSPWESDV